MTWQANPDILLLLASAAITAALAVYAWQHRTTPGAIHFTVVMLAVTDWSLTSALAFISPDPSVKFLLAKTGYLGTITIPPAWLTLALQYTGKGRWMTRRTAVLLTLVPLITMILVVTNELHGLVWSRVWFEGNMQVTYGVWFWVYAAYSYLLLFLGTLLFILMFMRSPRLYRWQTSLMLVGALVPWIANGIYLYGQRWLPDLDPTPLAFTITGLVATLGLFGFHTLDIAPIARGAVIESMSDGMLVLDARNRIVDLNPAGEQMIGLPASHVIGRQAAEMLSFWPDLIQHYQDAMTGQTEITLGEGEAQRHYDVRISSVNDQQGHVTGRLVILRDATQHYRAEAALWERNHELALLNSAIQTLNSTLNFDKVLVTILEEARHLLDADACSVWLIDPATNELVCREAASPRSDVVRGWRLPMGEGLVGWVARNGKSLVVPDTTTDERHFRGVDQQTGMRLRSILSTPLWVSRNVIGVLQVADVNANRFHQADLELIEPLAAAAASAITNARLYERARQEIDERERVEAVLRQQARELEARNEELDAFAHTVAHDLRNPLSLIIGYASVLIGDQDTLPQADREKCLNDIVQTARRMDNIVQELLLLSEVRQVDVGTGPLEMASIVAGARLRLAYDIETRQAKLVVPPASGWPGALGYGPWVEEVWVNYIGNAIKYGGRPPCIELGAEAQPDGMVRFWVRDNGPGIAVEDQAQLFRPFTRLGQVRAKGHGLGLSIVRRIVEKLGGTVAVESQVGRGSVFSFTLPGVTAKTDDTARSD